VLKIPGSKHGKMALLPLEKPPFSAIFSSPIQGTGTGFVVGRALVSTEATWSRTCQSSRNAAPRGTRTPEKQPRTARGIGPHLLPLSKARLTARCKPCKRFDCRCLCQ
jgi:hypothetical protein